MKINSVVELSVAFNNSRNAANLLWFFSPRFWTIGIFHNVNLNIYSNLVTVGVLGFVLQ